MVERRYFAECLQRVHSVYVTYSQNKSMVFAMQKYGFCFLNVMLLQIGRTHFVVECGYFAECLPYYSNSPAALLADR